MMLHGTQKLTLSIYAFRSFSFTRSFTLLTYKVSLGSHSSGGDISSSESFCCAGIAGKPVGGTPENGKPEGGNRNPGGGGIGNPGNVNGTVPDMKQVEK
jgi:hypothetical protein